MWAARTLYAWTHSLQLTDRPKACAQKRAPCTPKIPKMPAEVLERARFAMLEGRVAALERRLENTTDDRGARETMPDLRMLDPTWDARGPVPSAPPAAEPAAEPYPVCDVDAFARERLPLLHEAAQQRTQDSMLRYFELQFGGR